MDIHEESAQPNHDPSSKVSPIPPLTLLKRGERVRKRDIRAIDGGTESVSLDHIGCERINSIVRGRAGRQSGRGSGREVPNRLGRNRDRLPSGSSATQGSEELTIRLVRPDRTTTAKLSQDQLPNLTIFSEVNSSLLDY